MDHCWPCSEKVENRTQILFMNNVRYVRFLSQRKFGVIGPRHETKKITSARFRLPVAKLCYCIRAPKIWKTNAENRFRSPNSRSEKMQSAISFCQTRSQFFALDCPRFSAEKKTIGKWSGQMVLLRALKNPGSTWPLSVTRTDNAVMLRHPI